MKNEKSWTRQEYNNHCRWMRRGFTFKSLMDAYPDQSESIKAADYSYQAKDYVEMGWSGEMRRHRFHAILVRVYASRGEIPF